MAIIKKTEREKQADKLVKYLSQRITDEADRNKAMTRASELYLMLDKPRRKKGVSADAELTAENSYCPPKHRIKTIQNMIEKEFSPYFEAPKKQKEEKETYNPFLKAVKK